jgi:hypothetical protein
MAKQLLITLLVAAIVLFVARMKRIRSVSRDASSDGSDVQRPPSTTALVGYVLAAVMIVTAGTLTWMGYQERNEILEVVVVDTRNGERVVYSVRRKALGEREFRTIDGRLISLGSADRMELIERE